MKVLKFGGTSVGSPQSLLNVKKIVDDLNDDAIVVVSALSKVTNKLIELTDAAQNGDEQRVDKLLTWIYRRHCAIINAVYTRRPTINAVRRELKSIIQDKLRAACQRLMRAGDDAQLARDVRNQIVTTGEMMSSVIVSVLLGARLEVSTRFIKTRNIDGCDVLVEDLTQALIASQFRNLKAAVTVVQGFVAQDCETLAITTLGRGGSDFTAALIAAALNASCLEIWTDVDGFMTADPRKDRKASVIPRMTYEEAQQRCDAGAKVIYPPTIKPVALKGIPVWVKNTLNPAARGTRIGNPKVEPGPAKIDKDKQIFDQKQFTIQWDS